MDSQLSATKCSILKYRYCITHDFRLLAVSILLMAITGCTHKQDFAQIKNGMHTSEVIRRVGTPQERRHMGEADWWLYADSAEHIVVVAADTVANCLTRRQAMQIMTTTLNALDSLHRK